METQALALHQVFEDNKIFGSIIESWQGPRVLVYRIKLHSADSRTISRVRDLADPIQSQLLSPNVRVSMVNGVVHIEIPSPWPVDIPAYRLRGTGLIVPLGATGRLTDEGEVETVDMDFGDPSYPHLGVVGATGTGKTTAMQAICYHLARQNSPRDVRFAVVAPENKLDRWTQVTNLPHSTHGIGQLTEIRQFMAWAAKLAITRRAGSRPHWFVVIDDVLALLKVVNIRDALGTLASQGREPGIHLIIGSQKLGESGAGGSDITANLRARLLLAAASAQDAAMLAGRSRTGAESLEGSGDALLVRGSKQERVSVAMATAEDFSAFPIRQFAKYPWQDYGSAVAVDDTVDIIEVLGALKPGDPLPEGPLLKMIEPDEHDKEVLRLVYDLTGSSNMTLKIVYGGKNGRVLKWLNEVIK